MRQLQRGAGAGGEGGGGNECGLWCAVSEGKRVASRTRCGSESVRVRGRVMGASMW